MELALDDVSVPRTGVLVGIAASDDSDVLDSVVEVDFGRTKRCLKVDDSVVMVALVDLVEDELALRRVVFDFTADEVPVW